MLFVYLFVSSSLDSIGAEVEFNYDLTSPIWLGQPGCVFVSSLAPLPLLSSEDGYYAVCLFVCFFLLVFLLLLLIYVLHIVRCGITPTSTIVPT